MKNENELQTDNPCRWGYLFALLSLDLVNPYVADMRLQLPKDSRFMVGIRELIRNVRTVQEPSFADSVWQWLKSNYDPEFIHHLFRWGMDVFHYEGSDGLNAFHWKLIIWGGNVSDSTEMDSGPAFIHAVRLRIAEHPHLEIDQKTAITVWDREVFKREDFNEFTLEVVERIVNKCHFIEAWLEALYEFDGNVDLVEIHAWGMKIAERMGVPRDELGEPGDWPSIPLPWR